MAALNYAVQYAQALANAYPYVLHFGALYNTPNNGRYRVVNAKTIEIPLVTTSGRVDGDRDTIATAARNYQNSWETKALQNERKWSTLVHPKDVEQTNQVTSIQNITQVYNETQKFPEMDSYLVSKLYADWTALGKTPDTTALTTENILQRFDQLMEEMDEANVPPMGRILYVTPGVKTLLKNAKEILHTVPLKDAGTALTRDISRIDEVEIESVPSQLMKTVYDFTVGCKPGVGAKQIHMLLCHPSAVITPVSYSFAQLDEPSAMSEGKYVYYEESHEDVFILGQRAGAMAFVVEA